MGLPSVSMIYDFAPVNMKITKTSRDLTRFLVNVRVQLVGDMSIVMCHHWRSIRDLRPSEQVFAVVEGGSVRKRYQMKIL